MEAKRRSGIENHARSMLGRASTKEGRERKGSSQSEGRGKLRNVLSCIMLAQGGRPRLLQEEGWSVMTASCKTIDWFLKKTGQVFFVYTVTCKQKKLSHDRTEIELSDERFSRLVISFVTLPPASPFRYTYLPYHPWEIDTIS